MGKAVKREGEMSWNIILGSCKEDNEGIYIKFAVQN